MQWRTKGFWQKQREKYQWHRWFAWFPVELGGDGSGRWVWLETVARKCYTGGHGPEDVWFEYNTLSVAQLSEDAF